MAVLQTYTVSTNREDLSDLISNISPTDTPFFSLIPKTKATNTLHETQKDELAAAGSNAAVEGAEFAEGSHNMPDRVTGYTQIFRKDIKVSDTQRAVNTAGIKDTYNYQVTKKLKEIANDVEWACFNETGNAGNASTARRIKGVLTWITSNTTDAVAAQLTEDNLNDALQSAWEDGGKPGHVFVGGYQKRKISSFTGGATKNVEAGSKKLIASVDVYESDFGLVRIVLERYIPTDDIAIVDKELWEWAWLRKTKHTPMPKSGDSTRGMIVGEATLIGRNEAGNAEITNLAATV